MVTFKMITKDLERMGIGKGDKIIVHSSLKSIGFVEGGADTLVNALLYVIGKDGLIMMPTFTYSYEGSPSCLPYNKVRTPSLTGHVSDVFWRRPDAIRSAHPTHSMAAIGRDAEKYIKDHLEHMPPFNEDSPAYRLAEEGGKVLLIGVGHEANSTIHVAEFAAELPFLHIKNRDSYGDYTLVEKDNGSIGRIPLSHKLSGCSLAFGRIETINEVITIQYKAYVGNALSRLLKGKDLVDLVVARLKKDPGFLLCDGKGACNCNKKRSIINVT